ncbi:MAG TPA: Sua5/YciO/YrdC/YwlC family protein, partial [Propionibacteriaceae bacterium]|nr:Sua5/YciO/YrdC/YwlC family protein [Propionibacteriaceae bacterium]
MSEFQETDEAESTDSAVVAAATDDSAGATPEEPRWTRFDVAAEPHAALEAAQRAVAAGECIVLPTDTVYGIGVGAFSAEAVQRLLEAKRRGRDMPPPVLIAEPAMLGALATSVSAWATSLAEAYWPGPLTLILTAHPSLHMDLGDTRGTIAVRVPDHDFT